jgi:PAS domain S-box-containing protein
MELKTIKERGMFCLQRFNIAWKAYIIVTVIITIAAAIIVGYFISERKNVLIMNKQLHLFKLASTLENKINHDDSNNRLSIPQADKTAIINKLYQPLLSEIAKENPECEFGIFFDKPTGWTEQSVVNITYPIHINGQLTGHIGANYKWDYLNNEINQHTVNLLIFAFGFWLLVLLVIYLVFYRLTHEINRLQPISNETEASGQDELFQQTRLKLAHLIDLCPLPILELDSNGCIANLNKAMQDFYNRYLAYSKESLIGESIQSLSSQLGIEYKKSFIARVMNGQEIRNEYARQLDCDWLLHGAPIIDAATGSVNGAIAIYHDISEAEKTKQEMARLEGLNAIGETAGSVAHELRNPACTIRGFVELLQRKCREDQKEYYGIILEELDRMNGIIEDFLSLTRNRLIDKMPLDINEVLRSLYPLILSDALKNGIELEYNLCDKAEALELNSREIRQLVLNLARNGIDAMSPRGTLRISTEKVMSGINLVIQDTGTGIQPELLNKIFEPFYTSKKNGTGLGLAVCRNIVKGHAGAIKVESEVDKGTTFTMFFPSVKEECCCLPKSGPEVAIYSMGCEITTL